MRERDRNEEERERRKWRMERNVVEVSALSVSDASVEVLQISLCRARRPSEALSAKEFESTDWGKDEFTILASYAGVSVEGISKTVDVERYPKEWRAARTDRLKSRWRRSETKAA